MFCPRYSPRKGDPDPLLPTMPSSGPKYYAKSLFPNAFRHACSAGLISGKVMEGMEQQNLQLNMWDCLKVPNKVFFFN